MRYLVLALFMFGCGPEGWTYETKCLTFDSWVGLDAPTVTEYEATARTVLDGRFGDGTLCALNVGPIEVKDVFVWECPFGLGDCTGFTDVTGHIQVGKSGLPLLHEILHVKDQHEGIFTTGSHPDWESKGYYALDRQFKEHRAAEGIWVTP